MPNIIQKQKKLKKKSYRKKYKLTLTNKQAEILYIYSKYSNENPGKILSKAVTLYIKQLSKEIEQFHKISNSYGIKNGTINSKQMEINFSEE